MVFYLLLAVYVFVRYWFQPPKSYLKKRDEVREMRDRSLQVYNDGVDQRLKCLEEMTSITAHMAEHCFEEKRGSFEKFLEHVSCHTRRFFQPSDDPAACLEAVQHFVALWSVPYAEHAVNISGVSLQPIAVQLSAARESFGSRELEAVCSVAQGRRWRALSADPLLLFKPKPFHSTALDESSGSSNRWLQLSSSCGFGFSRKSSEQENSDAEDLDEHGRGEHRHYDYPADFFCGCLRVTFMSRTQVIDILATSLGFFVAGLLVWRCVRSFEPASCAAAVVAVFVEVLALWMVMTFHDVTDVAALEREIEKLHLLTSDLEGTEQQLHEVRHFMEQYHIVWTNRTLPFMDVFEQLHLQLEECPVEERLGLMQGMSARAEALLLKLGDADAWCGDNPVDSEHLRFVTHQLERTEDFLKQSFDWTEPCETPIATTLLRHLDQVFGCLVIKIVGAKNLLNRGWAVTSSPFVVVTLTSGQTKQTATVSHTVDPLWDEEFRFPLAWNDTGFELHVWSQARMSADASLGRVTVPLDKVHPGHWHTKHGQLVMDDEGYKSQGTVDYVVYLATEVDHFRHLRNSHPPARATCRSTGGPPQRTATAASGGLTLSSP